MVVHKSQEISFIPYGKQELLEEDISSVVEVLKSEYLTQGPSVAEFEKTITKIVGAGYGVAVNSATAALHIACLALGLKEGDRVWTSTISFVASANCAKYCGATVEFLDIDYDTFNVCVKKLEEALLVAERYGTLPKIVIPVAMCGQSAPMSEIHRLSKRFNFKIIEDASHAIGGKYKGKSIGGHRYADITVFSFHPVKIITSGEGGIAVTHSCELADKMRLLRSHGIVRELKDLVGKKDGDWYYEQVELGFNYRLSDIHAALGSSQAQRLPSIIERRQELANLYDDALRDLPIDLPKVSDENISSWHLYVIRLRSDDMDIKRMFFDEMRLNGIGVQVHYIPIHLHPYYHKNQAYDEYFPNAMKYYRNAVTIPLFPSITADQQKFVINNIKASLEKLV
ncbi:UDP-4-amino-4,6-dideoxy-N-acetyl-beta-L-altrosamine transaminase [bacterium]|nr:UDP-4-amino-4,6-dideoxy-N-acetyl-beta-L-altrosamine transaminase [bacterium]